DEKSETRLFQGEALLRRMIRLGLLLESEKKLDYVLGLTTAKIMERRLQTKVFKLGLAKSIHHARTLIRQRHIRVGKQICDIPSFLVRLDSEKHIDFALTSPFGGGRPGRVRRKNMASKGAGGGGGVGDDEEGWDLEPCCAGSKLQVLAMGKKSYRNNGSTFRKPKRPFEKERLDAEMKIVGEYGLKNKREVWRVQYALAKIRTAARTLLTQDEKSETRLFQGEALLRRMIRLGLLLESEKKLDYVLGLTTAKIMERRLQTKVFKLGLAKSIHHARTLIRQRHIRVGKQICDIPSFLVRLDSEKHIDFALTSPFGGGRPGRVRRKNMASKGAGGGGGGGDDEED
ncbi:unnamed protein product, partial [Polarella glacialis]